MCSLWKFVASSISNVSCVWNNIKFVISKSLTRNETVASTGWQSSTRLIKDSHHIRTLRVCITNKRQNSVREFARVNLSVPKRANGLCRTRTREKLSHISKSIPNFQEVNTLLKYSWTSVWYIICIEQLKNIYLILKNIF